MCYRRYMYLLHWPSGTPPLSSTSSKPFYSSFPTSSSHLQYTRQLHNTTENHQSPSQSQWHLMAFGQVSLCARCLSPQLLLSSSPLSRFSGPPRVTLRTNYLAAQDLDGLVPECAITLMDQAARPIQPFRDSVSFIMMQHPCALEIVADENMRGLWRDESAAN